MDELPADPTVPGYYLRADYYELLADLRRDAPVHEFAPGMRTIARYDDIREISRDPGALLLVDGRARERSDAHLGTARRRRRRSCTWIRPTTSASASS